MGKKRQCVLCDDGKVVTSVPKDRAVCHACAQEMSPGCTHECDHWCHDGSVVFIMECMCCHQCDLCGRRIVARSMQQHRQTCHAELDKFQSYDE